MERQRQMVGDSSHSSEVLGEYLQLHQDYFDRELKPQFEAAETDCSLFRSLLPRVLGIQRQQQLVGYAQDPPFMGTSTFQKARCNCFQELASACEEKNISSESFTRGLLGMERQAQLLGGSMDECGLGNVTDWISDAVNNRLPCLTEWIGKVTYSEKKSFTRQTLQTTPEGAVTTVTENETIEMQFEGGVERVELEDDSIPGLFTALTWDLHLNPDVTGSYSFRRESGASFVCKPNADGVKEELTVDSSAANGEGSSSVVVHFVFEEGELTAFTLRQPESFKLAVPGRLSMTRTECPKRNPVTGMLEEQSPRQIFDEATKSTHSFSVDYVPSSQVNLTRISEDELVGTATGIRLERALPTVPVTFVEVPYKWTFSLRRRK